LHPPLNAARDFVLGLRAATYDSKVVRADSSDALDEPSSSATYRSAICFQQRVALLRPSDR